MKKKQKRIIKIPMRQKANFKKMLIKLLIHWLFTRDVACIHT